MAVVSSWEIGAYMAGEGSCVLYDRAHRLDGSKRGCLYFWGRGNQAWQALSRVYWNGIQRDFAEEGMPVASGDLGSMTHWGSPTAVARTESLRAWAATRGLFSPNKVVLFGVSMGALAALNYARAYPTKVAAIVLVTPVVSLSYYHDTHNGGSEAAQIETAYGGLAAYQAALPTSDPTAYIASLGIPIKVWYSTSDPDIPVSLVQSFATAANAETASLGAVDHSAGALTGPEVMKFFRSH